MTNKTLGILLAGLFFLQSCAEKETKEDSAALAGAEVYQTNCAACHNGALAEAPKLASLQLLSKEMIVKTLRTGVMRNQANTLSKEQHEQLAAFITAGKESEPTNTVISGKCDEESPDETADAKPLIGNWGMGLQNKRYYGRRRFKNYGRQYTEPKIELDLCFSKCNTSTFATNYRRQYPVYCQSIRRHLCLGPKNRLHPLDLSGG